MNQHDIQTCNIFICVGVEKCGTTSLHELLKEHDGFAAPKEKETRFFSVHYDKGPDYQAELYPQSATLKNRWLLDITPSYFRRPTAYRRINEYCQGEIAVVFLIRNPIRRAFSQYWHDIFHHVTWAQNLKSIEEFRDFSFYRLFEERHSYYFTAYADHIEMARSTFGDRIAFGVFEEFVQDPAPLLRDISRLTGARFDKNAALPKTNELDHAVLAFNAERNGLDRIQNCVIRHALDVFGEDALRLLAQQGTFTHFVPQETCEEWFAKRFRDDCRRCEDLLSQPLERLWTQSNLLSPIYKLPQLAETRRQ